MTEHVAWEIPSEASISEMARNAHALFLHCGWTYGAGNTAYVPSVEEIAAILQRVITTMQLNHSVMKSTSGRMIVLRDAENFTLTIGIDLGFVFVK